MVHTVSTGVLLPEARALALLLVRRVTLAMSPTMLSVRSHVHKIGNFIGMLEGLNEKTFVTSLV